jgi:2,3-dihydroxybiphenyl 1,2-dioxygenase
MQLLGLGYVGVGTDRLDDWNGYGRDLLGLQPVDRTTKSVAFRMDDRRQRIFVAEDGTAGCGVFGWEVAGPDALDRAAAELDAQGLAVTPGDAALASERRVSGLVHFRDPAGNRVELFHGPEIADAPFSPGRSISGFRTGPLGMGHVVLTAERIDPLVDFYREVLGFRLSDYALKPFKATFLHVNPRHHSLAFVETGRAGTHHLMMELMNLDDVGQGYDLAQGLEGNIGATLGRHTNDFMTSFYSWTPSRFMVEYGWGGREIDPAGWQPYEMADGPSLWGHDRTWLDEAGRRLARDMRLEAAKKGMREPVQVVPGNHNVMSGVCGWWDAATGRR